VSAPNALCMSYACVMDWHGYRNADSMSRQRYSTEGPPSHLSRSEPAAPVFDAVMVGCESVADAPQNRLSAAGDVDLAIDRSDVELHRVRTRCVSGATSALLRPWVISAKISDSRSVIPHFVLTSSVGRCYVPEGWPADHDVAAVDRFERVDEVARG
jgi:hypothetical protein